MGIATAKAFGAPELASDVSLLNSILIREIQVCPLNRTLELEGNGGRFGSPLGIGFAYYWYCGARSQHLPQVLYRKNSVIKCMPFPGFEFRDTSQRRGVRLRGPT